MSTHNDVVSYCWTEFDRMGLSSPIPNTTVTPYQILPSKIPNASDYDEGDYVDLSLGWSIDPPTIARFFRNGYQWVPLPPEVPASGTLLDLFGALFAYDPVGFAHFDPALNVLTNVSRDVQSIQSAPRTFGIPLPDVSSMIPFGDLATLHFEYWGNTDLRAAVFRATATDATFNVLGIADVTMPVLGTNPFTDPMGFLSGPMAELMPQLTPCQKDGAVIQFVLQRCPVVGGTIQAPPSTQSTDAPIVIYSIEPPRIELNGWAKQTLAPVLLNQWQTRSSNISFRITLPSSSVATTIEILRAGVVYYSEVQTIGQFLIPGVHLWTWDGYDNQGVLDTRVLKENTFSARVTTVDTQGRVASSTTDLGIGCEKIRWLDARVDSKKKHADLTVFQKYSNPSDVDLASFNLGLPSILGSVLGPLGLPGAPSMPSLPSLPGGASIPGLPNLNDLTPTLTIPKSFDLPPDLFMAFKTQIKASIGAIWSRDKKEYSLTYGFAAEDISGKNVQTGTIRTGRDVTIDGTSWTITASCQERSVDFLHTFLMTNAPEALKELGIGHGSELPSGMLSRSVNLSTLMEGLPILDVWDDADDLYMSVVGAHEVGHSVLRDCINVYKSLTHKGTSDVMQKTLPSAPKMAGPTANQGSEIDVMLYWNQHGTNDVVDDGKRVLNPDGSDASSFTYPKDYFHWLSAVETDTLGLLSMAKVTFG